MDSYTVLRVIGEGSFGRALLAHPKDDSGHYVIKEVHLPKTQSGQVSSRTEVALLSRMKHANIVAFREAFEAEGHLYIVMEYCAGGDLLQRIKRQKSTQFSVDVILGWFAQMCLGAKHVHDKHVLHRDLKSKNIFLTGDGTVKLGDFGSACVLNSSKAYARSYVGTPYYVSPEIWDSKPYNNKSDVWSLGCVLYELCTLRHPFQAHSWKSLILKVCRGAYPPLPNHLPYELHYVLKQMFRTNPRDRPSLNTILTSHRIAKLLQKHLPAQQLQEEVRSRWRKEEGGKVAMFLGQKSLIQTASPPEPFAGSTQEAEDRPRRKWAGGPPNTVLQFLGNADLISSSSTASGSGFDSSSGGSVAETQRGPPRRQWDQGAPERLLSLLDKACQNMASRTYTVHRGDAEGLLMGPLSQAGADSPDGVEEEEEEEEESRLEPRSDDEDTDFEEESPCDLVEELEKMVMEP